MKQTITVKHDVEITTAECEILARYFEDACVDGVPDDSEHPVMPCVKSLDCYKRKVMAWCPVINLDEGRITNWTKGVTASIHYKSCDENTVTLFSDEGNPVKVYEGYVPKFLSPKENGYGDYVIMDIDGEGYIKDFKPYLDDMFMED